MIKIFDDDKALRGSKMISIIFLAILFLWFSFDMTGLSFGETKIVTSAFVDEPIDFAWWLVFALCIVLFVLKDRIGRYAVTVFLFVWALIQYTMYLKSAEGIERYNNYFSDTHRIISVSDRFLIKDTYHLFLDILILLALIAAIIYVILKIKIRPKKEKQ